MGFAEILASATDSAAVSRVFAEPVERGGVTVIAAASVSGGGGGGDGTDSDGREGSGGGAGVRARPVGAFVIVDGEVRWEPAIDINRLVATVVGVVGVVVTALGFVWARAVRLRGR